MQKAGRKPRFLRVWAPVVLCYFAMDFEIPSEIQATLDALDEFIEREIKPLEAENDNIRFFDHRREWARTDFENGGVPRKEWEELLREMRRRADAAGWLRLALPEEYGGRGASNLEMAIIREHLAAKGLGLHNDLQNESSIVGNFPTVLMMRDYGTPEQKAEWMPGFFDGTKRLAFGLTEPNHGSDATYLETTAVRDGDEWVINGMKRFNSGLHHASHDIIFARTSGEPGEPVGITAFLVPTDAEGFSVDFFWWTFNMPTDHAEVSMKDVRVGPGDGVRPHRPRPRPRPAVRAREPHPAGGVVARRRAVLHRRSSGLRQLADHVGQEAIGQPGHPVPAGRAAHPGSDAAPARSLHGLADGPEAPHGDHPPRGDVQLPGQPARLRRGRPGHADLRRRGLHAGTCPSSTSTATTVATASPKGRRRSRCARWRSNLFGFGRK